MNLHEGQPVATHGRPLAESQGVVIMMHGRGSNTDDILALADRIGDKNFSYLAPAAKDGTWYPHGFMEALHKNEPYLSDALAIYDRLINELQVKGFSKQQIVL